MPGSKFSSIGLHKDGEGISLLSSSICPLLREVSQYTGGQRPRPWIHFSHFDLCCINISGAYISPEVKKKSPNPKSSLFGSAPSLIHCWPCLIYPSCSFSHPLISEPALPISFSLGYSGVVFHHVISKVAQSPELPSGRR